MRRKGSGLQVPQPAPSVRIGTSAGIAVLAACAAAFAAPASAASSGSNWDPPRELSTASSAPISLAATAGIDDSGNGVVLWHAKAGIESVLRPVGRGFGDPAAIRGSRLSMPDLRPQLAFDPRGAALAIWSYFEPHPQFVEDGYSVDYTFGLRVAGRSVNGGFGRAQTLTDKLDTDPSADVAFASDGTAVVIWADEAGVHAAARPAGKRRFGAANVIGQSQTDPQVSTGTSGSATAAWAESDHGTWSVSASESGGYSGFGLAAKLPIDGLGDAQPVVGVDGRSTVTAAWVSDGRVLAVTCSASGHCGGARALSPATETAVDPHIAVATDGSAVVAWRSDAGVSASMRRGHRTFGPSAVLSSLKPGQKVTDLAVAAAAKGDAAALWTVHAEDGDRVAAALKVHRRRFTRAHSLTALVPGAAWSDPQIVLGNDGAALAIWGAMIDGHPSIEAAIHDVKQTSQGQTL